MMTHSADWYATRGRRFVAALLVAAPGVLGAVAAHADTSPAIELQARGVQVYTCEGNAASFAWRLKGPEAVLFDTAGAEAGRHFAGPSWQANDGSVVVGEPVASSRSPSQGSVPWLVLRAKSHAGAGVFAAVDYVARVQTVGGAAPAGGCDEAHAGSESRVDYTAFYVFFSH
jgi:hypothetical protein